MKTITVRDILILSSICILLAIPSIARADEVYCEVMSVHGTATVVQNGANTPIKEGGYLRVGDTIQVGQDSYVDLAYDKAWKNVTRIRENSEVKMGSIQPTHLDMKYGDIFSRIKALPKASSFEIQTPTAIASVRGTEFRTVTEPDGKTEIHNLSELPTSQVLVFGLDSAGNRQLTPVTLDVEKKTEIPKVGESPLPPKQMSPAEIAEGNKDNNELKAKTAFFGGASTSTSGDNKSGNDKKPGNDDKKLGANGPGNGPGGSDDSAGNTANDNSGSGNKLSTAATGPTDITKAPAGTAYDANKGTYTNPNGPVYNLAAPGGGTSASVPAGTYAPAPIGTYVAPPTGTYVPLAASLTSPPATTFTPPPAANISTPPVNVTTPPIHFTPPIPDTIQTISNTTLSVQTRLQQCLNHAQTDAERAACAAAG